MIIPVRKLTIITLQDYEEYLLRELGKLGVVELRKLSEGEVIGFRETTSEDVNRYVELYDRFKNLYNRVCPNGCAPLKKFEGIIRGKVPYGELDGKLKMHEYNILGLLNEIDLQKKYLDQLIAAKPIVERLAKFGLNPRDLGVMKHIFAYAILVNKDDLEKIRDAFKGYKKIFYKVFEYSEDRSLVYIGGLIDFKEFVDKFLSTISYEKIELPEGIPGESSEALKWLDEKIAEVKGKIDELEKRLEESKKSFLEEMDYLRQAIEVSYKISLAQNNLLRSKMMSVISGWVPEDKISAINRLLEGLKKETGGKLIVSFDKPRHDEEIPTVYKNPKIFSAYETLIRQYGVPDPTEIDPTIIAGILWTIMFGFMFPDLGQGIVVALLGAFFAYGPVRELIGIPVKRVGKLMIGAGIMAAITGLMTGDFFLMEHVIEPMWPGLIPGWLERPYYIIWLLKIAIFFGIAELVLGMLLRIYIELKRGHKLEALLGEHGAAGLMAFISLLLVIFEFIALKAAKDGTFTVIPNIIEIPALGSHPLTYVPIATFVIGIILIFYKSIAEGEGATLGFGVLIESLLSYLTNTLSFARLAGFAVAHVALSIVIAELAHAVGTIGGLVALVGLNIFTLTLELLVVMIQALRLTFYEFLTKFYRGTGVPFRPFKIA